MLDSSPGGMPIPVSVTVTTASVPARSMAIQMWPLSVVYRQALLTRLLKTCPRRAGSASTRIALRGGDADLVAGALDQRLAHLDGVADDASEIDALPAQLHPVVGDAADVEQVVHEPRHQHDLPLHHVRGAVDDRILLASALHQRNGVSHRRQRIPELVGEGRQEFVLAAVGIAQRLDELILGEPARPRLPADGVRRPPQQRRTSGRFPSACV